MSSVLSKRPQATAYAIEDLLSSVRRGEVRIPKFQRPFRWRAGDILKLFDSVYRGYPIGTLLFWKRGASAESVRFGSLQIDAPGLALALWVIDGQQRITSLAGVLLHEPYSGELNQDKFALFFDLRDETFKQAKKGTNPPPHWVPVNEVLDSVKVLNWLSRYPSREREPEVTQTAMKLSKAVREYQLPAYVVEADDETALREIFDRLNTGGRPLRHEEVFNALYDGLTGAEPSTLDALSKNLLALGFGKLDPRWLHKSVLAIRGLDVTRVAESQRKRDVNWQEALPDTERALRNVIVFLKRDAGIPGIHLLPYKLPLVPLAKFFHLHPEPIQRSRDLLARWLWRGAVTGTHSGDSVTDVRTILRAIDRNSDEEFTVQTLLSGLPPRPQSTEPGPFNFKSAEAKLQLNALVALRPRDLRDGQLIDTDRLIAEHGPRAVLPLVRPGTRWNGSKALLRGLSNRILHPNVRRPLDLIRSLAVTQETLDSHRISPEALESLRRDDVGKFLALREQSLERHLAQFLESRARWDESDRSSIQSLIVPDEVAG